MTICTSDSNSFVNIQWFIIIIKFIIQHNKVNKITTTEKDRDTGRMANTG